MLIRLGYDLRFEVPAPVAMVALLKVHPSRTQDLREPDSVRTEPEVPVEDYLDSFGNLCSRLVLPQGSTRLWSSALIEADGAVDPVNLEATQLPIDKLPPETLQFLMNSRYCEVDLLSNTAAELFGATQPGWQRVQAICDWVNSKVVFGYNFARPTKTALDVYVERTGVCRDFQHLAVTFCRCMNIPARYTTGYLGDFGVPVTGPMDFSAWFEEYLDDRWWTFDARFNARRIGRVLMATGRDASDVAITTSFGSSRLSYFSVVADEETPASAPASPAPV